MATQYTGRADLEYWQLDDPNWHVQYANTCARLDAVNAVGALCVRRKERPSTTLNVVVAAGSFRAADGSIITYAGTAAQLVTASTTTRLWLTDAGVLTTGASFPAATNIVRLASVTADGTTVTAVVDERVPYFSFGGGPGAANPDTSGAVLADLETEVNELKALLRSQGIMTP